MYGPGRPIHPKMKARIMRTLDRGLTMVQICTHDPQGVLVPSTLSRAVTGKPISERTERAILRSLEVCERDHAREQALSRGIPLSTPPSRLDLKKVEEFLQVLKDWLTR
jgi:hypothetical protein